ncbi:putative disease resistance protein At1g50180 [Rosa rugosa]|uniref:putative disease resistance protein At1g50180 n=1 Tax=Rosa rugosa TaxID=74645 RepID=UPI002B413432|nr:putative disease resistance protein At1g50180 [Rosa rugosa]
MAEGVVTVVAEGIKPLGEFIIQQAKILSGVSYQIELAQIELHLIRGFLKDADTRQQDEELVRICVKLIRDAAYDLEDVIESFALKVASRRRGGTVKIVLKRFACIFNEGLNRYKIGSEIEDIMTKLSHLRSSLQSYNIRQISGADGVASSFKRQRDRRLTYPHQVENHIVGLEESTERLVKELVGEGNRHPVVSIWGMGGSGKTTLAKQVFLQNEVKRHFDCFAWVCISQQWEGKDVLEDILIQLTPDKRKEISKKGMIEIAREVYSIQREQRCLVVLDDIWTQGAWHSIKAGFPINEETESRILLTTRKKEVAVLASGSDHLHQPQQLNDKQIWELFEKIAICGSDKPDRLPNEDREDYEKRRGKILEVYEKKRELGKKMLVHCSGLPLAISVLAGLLSRREKVEEWETVLRNVDHYIMRGANVLERENTSEEYGVSSVLALSYDDLPSHLKLCFLYLAQYPEDHEIQVTRLTQLWIAEGFMPSTSEIHGSIELMEDVSYGCLIELVQRSMVQVGKYSSSGKVKSCRLHDLMRDLCLQKAKEENFLGIVNFSVGSVSNATLIGKVRRLALYLDKNKYEFSSENGRDGHIRSLLYFAPEYFDQKWIKRIIRSVFNDFKLLRVLKFENICREFELPKTIGNLVHLRFLSLKDSAFRALPSSISNLVLLQTLDLRGHIVGGYETCFGFGWYSVTKIRNVFRNMEQLRHLYLPSWYMRVCGKKLSFARLCNLQTLVNVRIEKCDLNGLVQLSNLKKLSIKRSETSELEKLKDMLISGNRAYKHLRSLSLQADQCGDIGDIPSDIILRCPHLYKLRLDGSMTALPKELPNLTKLTLIKTGLKGDQIEILEKLSNLRVLYLGWLSFESKTMVFSQGGFPHLEFLTLHYLRDLNEWRVEKEAMPSLQRLRIDWCERLRAVPDGLQEITTLKELAIKDMPSRFRSRVGEGGEDFYKIKHVPSLIITNLYDSKKPEMEEAAGASQVDTGPVGDSHQELTVDAAPPAPDEKTEEIQVASPPNVLS